MVVANQKYIFFSYRSTEAEFALRLAADLKNAGINLWMDRLDLRPGDDWPSAIEKALNECAAMISVLSPDYIKSRYCKRELTRADRIGRPIFPVLLRPIPVSDWPLEIERQQYISFTDWRDEAIYQKQLKTLTDSLKEEFPDAIQYEPDPQTRYLISLVAELETQSGILEYIEPANQADALLSDSAAWSRLHFTRLRTILGAFLLVKPLAGEAYATVPEARKMAIYSLYDAIEKYPRSVLVAEPAMGKTTTLRQLILLAAQACLNREKNAPLPLWLKLSHWQTESDVESFIRKHWPFDSDPIKLLKRGEIALYLDGLDKLPSPVQDKLLSLQTWLHGPNAPARVFITCRKADYHGNRELDLPVIEITTMTPKHIREFVNVYVEDKASTALIEKIAPKGDWLTSIGRMAQHPFYLSAMILLHVSHPNAPLPATAGALLRRLTQILWENACNRATHKFTDYETLNTALIRFAFALQEAEMPAFVPVHFALEYLQNHTNLNSAESASLLRIADGAVRFAYEPLRDYFAALGLQEEGVYTRLMPPHFDRNGRRTPTKWDMPVRLLVGLSESPDLLIQTIADVDPYLAIQCLNDGLPVSDATRHHVTEHLIYQLETEACIEAADALATLGHSQSEDTLLSVLREGKWELRRAAYTSLMNGRQTQPNNAVQAFKVVANQGLEHTLLEAAVTALRQLGDSTLVGLMKLLYDEQWQVRQNTAWALGQIRDSAAVPALVEALQDNDSAVVVAAATALGQIRDSAAIEPLIASLNHDQWRVKRAAAEALAQIGQSAIEPLLHVLKTGEQNTRRLAIEALKTINDERARRALLDATYDTDVNVRTAAVGALENMEDPEIVQRLIQLLKDSARASWSRLRISEIATRILETINSEAARVALRNMRRYGDPNPPKGSSAKAVKNRLKEDLDTDPLPSDMPSIKEQLQSPDWTVRRKAISAIIEHQPETAAQHIIPMLKDNEPQVRIAAAEALGKIGTEAAIDALITAFADDELLVYDAAKKALIACGRAARDPLLRALSNRRIHIRAGAIQVLKHLADPTTVKALSEKLQDNAKPTFTDQPICELAASALQAIGTQHAFKIVQKWRTRAKTRYYEERGWRIGSSISAPDPLADEQREVLLDLLAEMRNPNWEIKQQAAEALREYAKTLYGLKDPIAIEHLSEALNDADWTIRWGAAEALAWIGDPAAIPALKQAIADSVVEVRIAVIRALLEIGDPASAPTIIHVLTNDKNSMAREAAAEALGIIGDTIALPTLIRALDDEDSFVRVAAVQALARLPASDVIKAMLKALDDKDIHVRWLAAEALTQIATADIIPDLAKRLNDETKPQWEKKRVCDLLVEALEFIGTPEALKVVRNWRHKQE